jgi:hypothetical protein
MHRPEEKEEKRKSAHDLFFSVRQNNRGLMHRPKEKEKSAPHLFLSFLSVRRNSIRRLIFTFNSFFSCNIYNFEQTNPDEKNYFVRTHSYWLTAHGFFPILAATGRL